MSTDSAADAPAMIEPADTRVQAGCTAVVAVKFGNDLFVANAGDSRGVLCRSGQAVALSEDHKPAQEIERTRILNAGRGAFADLTSAQAPHCRGVQCLNRRQSCNLVSQANVWPLQDWYHMLEVFLIDLPVTWSLVPQPQFLSCFACCMHRKLRNGSRRLKHWDCRRVSLLTAPDHTRLSILSFKCMLATSTQQLLFGSSWCCHMCCCELTEKLCLCALWHFFLLQVAS